MKRLVIYTCLVALAAWTGLVVAYEKDVLPGGTTLAHVHLMAAGLAIAIMLASGAFLWLRAAKQCGGLRYSFRTFLLLVLLANSLIILSRYWGPWRCEAYCRLPQWSATGYYPPPASIAPLDSRIIYALKRQGIYYYELDSHITFVENSYDGRGAILDQQTGPYYHGFFSPDCRLFCISAMGDTHPSVWSVENGHIVAVLPEADASDISAGTFSPDNHLIITGNRRGLISIWNASTGEQLSSWHESPMPVYCIAVSPSQQTVFCGFREGAAFIWDTNSKRRLCSLPELDAPHAATYSPEGAIIAIGDNNGVIHVCCAHTGLLLAKMRGHSLPIRSLTFIPGYNCFVSIGADDIARIWHRVRPEWWWGWFCVPWTYVSLALFGLLVWSVLANRRRAKRLPGKPGPSAPPP